MAGGILGGKGLVGRLVLVVCAFAGLLIAWSSQSAASDVGGQLLVGLPPGVKIETSVAAINCIDTSSFPGFTTSSWREEHNFTMDTFTFSHGCGVRASWIKWNINIGAPYNDTGSIWVGQDSAGSSYYASCSGFKNVSCVHQQDNSTGTGLVLMPSECPRVDSSSIYGVNTKAVCSIPAYHPGIEYIVNANGRLHSFTVRNVGRNTCKTVGGRDIPSGGDSFFARQGATVRPNNGPCFLVFIDES
jgi:hypothetical protein